jgi:hypothetical protein
MLIHSLLLARVLLTPFPVTTIRMVATVTVVVIQSPAAWDGNALATRVSIKQTKPLNVHL